ncbi:hypothetical protein [Hyphobacterium sp.]|uniref:hypothetical protein n=1 Tax=Hyphobacterium sp. TaxID=2004662 RepID=UPI00374913DD
MINLLLLGLLPTTECLPLTDAEPLNAGDAFHYEGTMNGQPLSIVMRMEIVSMRGLQTTFRQGGGPSDDAIEMSQGTPIRGISGPTFPRSVSGGGRDRQWSYSPDPESVLASLQPGESREIFVHERSSAAGERYQIELTFTGCESLDIDGSPRPANVYRIIQMSDDEQILQNREVWLDRDSGWWLGETDHVSGVETFASSAFTSD